MRIFNTGQISPSEKQDILDKHRTLYNGFRTMEPKVSNEQPLYIQDFAGDKLGMTLNNKGEVKKYTNVGINESIEEGETCEQCGGQMNEGICEQCGSGEMEEGTGHLDDIYHEEDLNPSDDFDYVEGGGNSYGTFEKMHHMKEQDGEVDELGTHDLEKGKKYKYKTPSFDDEVEFDFEVDDQAGGDKMYKFKGKNAMNHLMAKKGVESFIDSLDEQGGNADDMNVSDVEAPYNFQSSGPMVGDPYPVNEDGDDFDELINMDNKLEDEREELEEDDFEDFTSAFDDEIDEVDVSGSQGIYGDMDPAYDFDSEGPGSAGPYQTRNEGETTEQIPRKHDYKKMLRKKDAISRGEEFDDNELDISDYGDDYNPESSSWEEITKMTGDDEFSNVDEDIRESLINQKNKINEMFLRMKVIK